MVRLNVSQQPSAFGLQSAAVCSDSSAITFDHLKALAGSESAAKCERRMPPLHHFFKRIPLLGISSIPDTQRFLIGFLFYFPVFLGGHMAMTWAVDARKVRRSS